MNALALASLMAAVLVSAASMAADGPAPAPGLEAEIRALTLTRAGKGGTELRRDEQLAAVARAHSRAMHARDLLTHELAGTGPAERVARQHRRLFGLVSENVGVQKNWPADADRAARLVDGWMNSRGHRRNILAPYDLFEVGCFGNRRTTYCTQLFVRRASRLAHDVDYRQPPGARLTLVLEESPGSEPERRISVAAAGAEAVDPGAAVTAGRARLNLPDAPGRYQLKLWTRRPGDALHFRIVDGPYVCVAQPDAPARDCEAG